MQYISPFHHLPADIVDTMLTSPNQIRLIRKRLLAEIELSASNSIIVNGRELSKFDVITLFDNLSDNDLLAIHLAIFQDKILLSFLEKGETPTAFAFGENPSFQTEKALSFVSPYYKEATIELLSKAFQQKNAKTYKAFFQGQHLLTEEDRFLVHEQISKKVKGFHFQLEILKDRIEEDINSFQKSALNALKLASNILILNELPEDFAAEREDIAYSINNLGCALINNSKNEEAIIFFEIAMDLICSGHIKGFFIRNLATARQNKEVLSSNSSENKTQSISIWAIIAIAIGIIRIIVALSSHNNHSSYNSTQDYMKNLQKIQNQTYVDKYLKEAIEMRSETVQIADMSYGSLLIYMKMGNLSGTDSRGKLVPQNMLKKGQNLFDSLFKSPSFSLNPKGISKEIKLKKKKIMLVNMTEYDCIILLKAQDKNDSSEYVTTQFSSLYLPAVDSFELNLKHQIYDIQPFIGERIMKRGANNKQISPYTSFRPPYYFAKNIRTNIDGLKKIDTENLILGKARLTLTQFGNRVEMNAENIPISSRFE